MSASDNTANVIAAMALGVSVIVGVANYLYTRRIYRTTTRPVLHPQLSISAFTGGVPGLPQTFFGAVLQNLSNSVAAANVDIRVLALRPAGNKWLDGLQRYGWPRRPILLKEWPTLPVLAANDKWTGGQPPLNESIEQVLAQNLPDVVREVKVSQQMGSTNVVQPDGQVVTVPSTYTHVYYELPVVREFILRLVIEFDSGAGAGRFKSAHDFALTPILGRDGEPLRLNVWHLEAKPRSRWIPRLPDSIP